MNTIFESIFFLIISILASIILISIGFPILSLFNKTTKCVELKKEHKSFPLEILKNNHFKKLETITIVVVAIRMVCYLIFHSFLENLSDIAFSEHPYLYTLEIVLYKYPLIIWSLGLLIAIYQIRINLKELESAKQDNSTE